MKKLISVLFSLTILLSAAMSVNANPDITVMVDGEQVVFDAKPEMVNERTMVPMRAIFEKLGAEVLWDQPTQTVTAKTADKTVTTTIGETSIYVNGEEKVMDVAPYIKDERTYVPARFVSEALECRVDWDQENYVVVITTATDDRYTFAYNTVRDCLIKNGTPMNEGEWAIIGSEDTDGGLLTFVCTYDDVNKVINVALSLGVADNGALAEGETAEAVQIVSATEAGESSAITILTVTSDGETAERRFTVHYKDGDATVENPENTTEGMVMMATEFWSIMDIYLERFMGDISVSDFGIMIPDELK